jgi:hypothetical protein
LGDLDVLGLFIRLGLLDKECIRAFH